MKRSFLSILAVVACALPLASRAGEVVVDVVQLAPWAMENPDKSSPEKYVGIYIDLTKEMEKRTGLKIVPRITPYARIDKDLQDGGCTYAHLAWSGERAAYATRGADIGPLEFGVRAVTGVPLKKYDDLKGISISTIRGLKLEPRFDADATLDKEFDTDYTIAVRKAEAGRVQAVAGALGAINRIIRHANLSSRFDDTLVLRTVTLTLHFPKKGSDPALEAKLNQAMSSLVADGTVKTLFDKWINH